MKSPAEIQHKTYAEIDNLQELTLTGCWRRLMLPTVTMILQTVLMTCCTMATQN